jgi:farnesyl diphosphate synthase
MLATSTLQHAMQQFIGQLQEQMEALLPRLVNGRENRLYEAMRYAALSPGKRLRPFLAMSSASLFGVSVQSSLRAASAIEFIHAYSLIHDDLPAMDNDDTRRGLPSCHRHFDEATAILAGDALLTLAFEVLADERTHHDGAVRAELVTAVAKAAGAQGMVGGQMLDMLADTSLSMHELTRLQRLKTGELFATSCDIGAILGKATRRHRQALRGYAHMLGLAFQLTDDLLDMLSDQHPERQDKSAGKPTFVSLIGEDQAKQQAKILIEQSLTHLDCFDERADLLRDLARFLLDRQY